MITLTRAGLLALVLGTHSAATAAQTQWYTVELIVFSMLEPDIASESWTERPGRPSLEGSIELMSTLGLAEDSELGSVAAFRALPDDDLALSKEWSRLKRSAGYRPLLRVAWRQPGFSREESRAVHLHTPLTDVERPALAPRRGRPPEWGRDWHLYGCGFFSIEAKRELARRVDGASRRHSRRHRRDARAP